MCVRSECLMMIIIKCNPLVRRDAVCTCQSQKPAGCIITTIIIIIRTLHSEDAGARFF